MFDIEIVQQMGRSGRRLIKTPKSLLVVLIYVLIYCFHTHFDLGLKVLLFVRHNACLSESETLRRSHT